MPREMANIIDDCFYNSPCFAMHDSSYFPFVRFLRERVCVEANRRINAAKLIFNISLRSSIILCCAKERITEYCEVSLCIYELKTLTITLRSEVTYFCHLLSIQRTIKIQKQSHLQTCVGKRCLQEKMKNNTDRKVVRPTVTTRLNRTH